MVDFSDNCESDVKRTVNHKANFQSLRALDSCSSFYIHKGEGYLIGHNLDEFPVTPTQGAIYINKRNEKRVGIDYSLTPTYFENMNTKFSWTSKYGSVTINTEGRDIIDGGLNEKGLYIQEMTLIDGQMPGKGTGDLPCIHMGQWQQYVLDNCSTVQEVIDCLGTVTLEGHGWHFFVFDAHGARAAIDFEKGVPVIHRDDQMPYTLMTNYFYTKEVEFLHQHQGFGGQKIIDFNDMGAAGHDKDTRFVHACKLIQDAPKNPDIDYAFNILFAMDRSAISKYGGGRHWSYVIDTTDNKVYFETRTARERKWVDLNAFDYTDGLPGQLLDIHYNSSGDVTGDFQPLTKESNQQRLDKYLEWLYEYGATLKKEAIDKGTSNEEAEKDYQDAIREVTANSALLSKYYEYLFSL